MEERGILIKNPNGGIFMSKTDKNSHAKVPKITEEEYTAYVNRLRELSDESGNRTGVEKNVERDENSVK